jgi:hypothetical protein
MKVAIIGKGGIGKESATSPLALMFGKDANRLPLTARIPKLTQHIGINRYCAERPEKLSIMHRGSVSMQISNFRSTGSAHLYRQIMFADEPGSLFSMQRNNQFPCQNVNVSM